MEAQKRCTAENSTVVTKAEEMMLKDDDESSDDMKLLVKEMMTHMRTQAQQLQGTG